MADKKTKDNAIVDILESDQVIIVDTKKSKDVLNRIMTPPPPHQMVHLQPVEHKTHTGLMFQRFKAYFKEDLVGFLEKRSKHKFRVVTSGGYGIKTLLETKHGLYDRVKTNDIDLTVSIYKCTMTSLECFQYWSKKLHDFFALQEHPSDFEVKVVNFNHAYVPVMNFHRDYVLMITYKGEEFVDVAITDQKLTFDMLDKKTSMQAGIPVKKEEAYLKEVLKLIYMETVPGVNEYSYAKRNPVTGMYTSKGIKDINRGKLLCQLVQQRKTYARYCELLQGVTIAKLNKMPIKKRDIYFKQLDKVVSPVASSS